MSLYHSRLGAPHLVNYLLRAHILGRIQDLVRGGSDKRPPTYLIVIVVQQSSESPFSQEKVWLKIFAFVLFLIGGSTEPPEPPLGSAPAYPTRVRGRNVK